MPDTQQSRLKELIAKGKEQGYLTFSEVNDHLPDDLSDPEQVEEIIAMINDMGIVVSEYAPDKDSLIMEEGDSTDEAAAEEAAAALAAGNTVVAKPAPQTPLIAALAVKLCHKAGIPEEVFQLLPGAGDVGELITSDPRLAGVAFTGSTDTARAINRTLAARDGPIATFIAETGGQNAMIVDSTALPEQVVKDAVLSAFGSAPKKELQYYYFYKRLLCCL